jgi:hypothetical protein
MTDTTTIDQANETIMAAETQALTDFNTKYAAFVADIQSILSTLGTGGPTTVAKQFLARAVSNTSMMAMDLATTMGAYGLNQPTT